MLYFFVRFICCPDFPKLIWIHSGNQMWTSRLSKASAVPAYIRQHGRNKSCTPRDLTDPVTVETVSSLQKWSNRKALQHGAGLAQRGSIPGRPGRYSVCSTCYRFPKSTSCAKAKICLQFGETSALIWTFWLHFIIIPPRLHSVHAFDGH